MIRNEELLNKAVEIIIRKLNVKAIILFGSRARGDWLPWSDYDLLVIADFKEKYIDRIKTVLELVEDVPLNIEPHPYTLKEALEMLKKGNPTIVNALEEGKILYSTEELTELIRTYEELKRKGLRKTKTSVIVP